jgi:hypothetical protein
VGIELTDDELREIREHAVARLQASFVEYVRLLSAVRDKLPAVTDDAIAAVKQRFVAGMHQDDGQAATHAALFCALYQLAMDKGKECILSLKAGRADSGVLRILMLVTSSAWESLAALAVVLNGGPLAQSFVDQQLGTQRRQSAAHAANQRHSQPGGYREKHEKLKAAWASGKYASRDECARQECDALGLSYSAARRALQGTPEPTRA